MASLIDPRTSQALYDLFDKGYAALNKDEMDCYKLWFIWKRGHPKYKKIAGWLYEDIADRDQVRDVIVKMEEMAIAAEHKRMAIQRIKNRPRRMTERDRIRAEAQRSMSPDF